MDTAVSASGTHVRLLTSSLQSDRWAPSQPLSEQWFVASPSLCLHILCTGPWWRPLPPGVLGNQAFSSRAQCQCGVHVRHVTHTVQLPQEVTDTWEPQVDVDSTAASLSCPEGRRHVAGQKRMPEMIEALSKCS